MTERDCEILFYAFRYCLGRMSYAVQDFCEYAKEHLQGISEKYLRLMDKEIDEAGAISFDSPIQKSGLGMDCDAADWRRLQGNIKEELENRKKRKTQVKEVPKEKKRNKYVYMTVLQGNYGHGWEDLVEADVNNKEELKEFRADVAAYTENESYPHRVIRRRVLNEE